MACAHVSQRSDGVRGLHVVNGLGRRPLREVVPHRRDCLDHGLLDLGINLIDTAPAYGLSESRIGNTLKGHRRRLVLSTKVGETFINGNSHHDFSSTAIEQSVVTSLKLLKTDHVIAISNHVKELITSQYF